VPLSRAVLQTEADGAGRADPHTQRYYNGNIPTTGSDVIVKFSGSAVSAVLMDH
jgi:hypothetical protein